MDSMLPIAAVLQLIGPLVSRNRHLAFMRFQGQRALHLLLVLFVAAAAYVGTLLALITVYPPHQAGASLAYGIGFACASLMAQWAVACTAPVGLHRVAIASAATLGMVLPLVLLVSHTIAGDARTAGFVWYLLGSLLGGTAGTGLYAHAEPAISHRRSSPTIHHVA
jgi:hypothetical protein